MKEEILQFVLSIFFKISLDKASHHNTSKHDYVWEHTNRKDQFFGDFNFVHNLI